MSDMKATLLRQDAAARARKRMFDMLVGYEPCRKLQVCDVVSIADWVSTVTFDAIREVDEKEDRA